MASLEEKQLWLRPKKSSPTRVADVLISTTIFITMKTIMQKETIHTRIIIYKENKSAGETAGTRALPTLRLRVTSAMALQLMWGAFRLPAYARIVGPVTWYLKTNVPVKSKRRSKTLWNPVRHTSTEQNENPC